MKRYLATICIATALCVPSMILVLAPTASASTHAAKLYRSPTATVHAYFQVLNAGLQSGDFSALASVYAPTATLTESNALGQTMVSRGTAEIIAFYKQVLYPKIAGYHLTQDAMRNLARSTILSYEHAGSPPLSVAARCSHVFVIKNGMIKTLDWVIFFPGQK